MLAFLTRNGHSWHLPYIFTPVNTWELSGDLDQIGQKRGYIRQLAGEHLALAPCPERKMNICSPQVPPSKCQQDTALTDTELT